MQSIEKWMPFYFHLPQRRNMIYSTKAMSSQLWNGLLKNSFEVAAKKRSHQLTLLSVLLTAVIVKWHCVFATSNWECPSERFLSVIYKVSESSPGPACIPVLVTLWDCMARLANQTLGFRLMYYWPGPVGRKKSSKSVTLIWCVGFTALLNAFLLGALATLPGQWWWLQTLHFFKNIWFLPWYDDFFLLPLWLINM